MREQFGKTIVELSERDSKIVLITGDVEHAMDEFKKRFPERFFNIGICEQSMISVAAGLASEGFRPIVYSITPFVIERPFEQVKLDIDEQNLPVILVGYSDYPTAGPTHSDLDCKALTSILKNTICYFPQNSKETKEMLLNAYGYERPAFISLKKDRTDP
jgi:transketolase